MLLPLQQGDLNKSKNKGWQQKNKGAKKTSKSKKKKLVKKKPAPAPLLQIKQLKQKQANGVAGNVCVNQNGLGFLLSGVSKYLNFRETVDQFVV